MSLPASLSKRRQFQKLLREAEQDNLPEDFILPQLLKVAKLEAASKPSVVPEGKPIADSQA